jgi:hypothetical protein
MFFNPDFTNSIYQFPLLARISEFFCNVNRAFYNTNSKTFGSLMGFLNSPIEKYISI